ncbi:MAG: ThiF family adenylyltransferase [Caldisphaera sp.]
MKYIILSPHVVILNSLRGRVYLRDLINDRSVLLPRDIPIKFLDSLKKGIQNDDLYKFDPQIISFIKEAIRFGIAETIDKKQLKFIKNLHDPNINYLLHIIDVNEIKREISKLKSAKISIFIDSLTSRVLIRILSSLNIKYKLADISRTELSAWQRVSKNKIATKMYKFDEESVLNFIKGSNLVVCLTDSSFSPIHDITHEVSFKAGIPWVGGLIDGATGFLGPFVIPDDTSCYQCFKTRYTSNTENIEEKLAYMNFLNKTPGKFALPIGLPEIMAGILSNEIVKFLTNSQYLELLNKVMSINNEFPFNITVEDVIKVPDCEVCGRHI